MQLRTPSMIREFEPKEEGYINEGVLYQLGNWTIEAPRLGRFAAATWDGIHYNSFIKHECNADDSSLVRVSVTMSMRGRDGSADPKCWRCHSRIPEEIQTLWILHNWEGLQIEKEKAALSSK